LLRAEESALFGETSNMLEIPFEPFFYVMFVGSAVYAAALLMEALLLLAGHRVAAIEEGLADDQLLQE
jgi:hypothetical protein